MEKDCLQLHSTRRIMFNYYYDFLYVPISNTNSNSGSTSSITLNNHELSMYSYEFIVDDRNLGGTLHLDLESRIMVCYFRHVQTIIKNWFFLRLASDTIQRQCQYSCLFIKISTFIVWTMWTGFSNVSRKKFDDCQIFTLSGNGSMVFDITIHMWRVFKWKEKLNKNQLTHLKYFIFSSIDECSNASLSLMFQISSSQCTKQQCGSYGVCRIMTSQQNVFSTCSCLAGQWIEFIFKLYENFERFLFSRLPWIRLYRWNLRLRFEKSLQCFVSYIEQSDVSTCDYLGYITTTLHRSIDLFLQYVLLNSNLFNLI